MNTYWRRGPYSTSFFLFSTRPIKAHSNLSILSPGVTSATPRSISCGPYCGRDLGKTSLNRARNVTMNYQTHSGLARFSRAKTRVKTADEEMIGSRRICITDRNIWIVRQDILVRRGGRAFWWRGRGFLDRDFWFEVFFQPN